MTTEKFQLLNMVEITADDDEQVMECHSSVRILDAQGNTRIAVPSHYVLYAAVDVVASNYNRSDSPSDMDEFVEMVGGMLRKAIEEITTSGLQ